VKRFTRNLAGLAVLGLATQAVLDPSTVGAVSTPKLGMMVPAYFWDSAGWTSLTTAASLVPLVAIVSDSTDGLGAGTNPSYAAKINAFRAAGGKAIGYVWTYDMATNNGASSMRPRADVENDIHLWSQFYNLDGIFVDHMGAYDPNLYANSYYKPLYNYIKSVNSNWTVWGNCLNLTNPPAWTYMHSCTDEMNIFENNPPSLFATWSPPSWTASYDKSRFSVLPYGSPCTASDMQQYMNKAVSQKIGWAYVTDGWNGQDSMPTFWNQEVSTVMAINGVPEPGTLPLLGAGLLSVLAYALRRRK
jgi:hypothetical protein